MTPKWEWEIEHCYNNGKLEEALLDAAAFVASVGERNVQHIVTHHNEEIDAWYVDVVYKREVKP